MRSISSSSNSAVDFTTWRAVESLERNEGGPAVVALVPLFFVVFVGLRFVAIAWGLGLARRSIRFISAFFLGCFPWLGAVGLDDLLCSFRLLVIMTSDCLRDFDDAISAFDFATPGSALLFSLPRVVIFLTFRICCDVLFSGISFTGD